MWVGRVGYWQGTARLQRPAPFGAAERWVLLCVQAAESQGVRQQGWQAKGPKSKAAQRQRGSLKIPRAQVAHQQRYKLHTQPHAPLDFTPRSPSPTYPPLKLVHHQGLQEVGGRVGKVGAPPAARQLVLIHDEAA